MEKLCTQTPVINRCLFRSLPSENSALSLFLMKRWFKYSTII